MASHRFQGGIVLTALLATSCVNAQTPPDAGALRQQIEQQHVEPLPQPATPKVETVTPTGPRTDQPLVHVRRFEFSGNKLLTGEDLNRLASPWLDRSLIFSDLQSVAAAISTAYREQGRLARVQLPRQDITNGVVRIEIVEAVFGRSALDGMADGRVPSSTVEAFVTARLHEGSPLDIKDLDRGLMLADDLPGVVVAGRLVAGDTASQTNVLLKLSDEPFVMGEAMVDNYGSRSTSATRVSTNLALTSPLGFGDLATASLIHSDGSDYAKLDYTVPVGVSGLRIGGSGSLFRYRLLSESFSGLDANGRSTGFGLHASYPLVRSRPFNFYFGAAWDRRNFVNQAGGSGGRDEMGKKTEWNANINSFDNVIGAGANSLALALVQTHVNLGGADNASHAAGDALGPRVSGDSYKLRMAASRQQTLTSSLTLFAAVSGQIANKNQDSSEKFFLGGPYGVRAYPVSEAGGSNGMLANLELRNRIDNSWIVTAFYDWGRVSVNVNNDYQGAPSRNSYSLQGVGMSVGWQGPLGLLLKTTWAHRLGNNPSPTANGQDQDGTLVRNRFWLSANLPY